MNDLFQGHFSSIEQTSGRLLSRCGLCDKYMKYISLKPARLHCLNCDMIYQVPQHGSIKLYMEQRCPIDQFEILMFSSGGENGITYTFCPQCYNNPPFEDFGKEQLAMEDEKDPADKEKKASKKYMPCSTCIHPLCKHSSVKLAVKKCDHYQQCHGQLIFSPISKPNWKLNCNSCNLVYKFLYNAHKVEILKKSACSICSAKLFNIEAHKDDVSLKKEQNVCLFCHPQISIEKVYGNLKKKKILKKKFKKMKKKRENIMRFDRIK